MIARVHGEPAGQTWGWPLTPNTRWWEVLQLDDPDIDFEEFTAEDGLRTFALSEIMVCSDYAGQGVGVLCTTKY